MAGAIASFSLMAVAGRELSDTLDTFEIMAFRSIVGLACVLSVGVALGRLSEVRMSHLGLHALRNVAHFTGQNLWFYAIATIPLAQVFALEFTSPLWVAVLAPLLLGETMPRARGAAIALGFIGILIVVRPGVV
ncbi:MAG: DMT family transporter, partial [Pseudomonadota bacterium]